MLLLPRLLCLATGATGAAIFGGTLTKEAAAGWLKVWRAAYKKNDGSVPELKDSVLPADLGGLDSMVVISSGGAAGGVVTEGMGYAIMVEGIHALGGSKAGLRNGLALTKAWLGMVYGPPETSLGRTELPLGGGSGEKGSATQADVPPYGVSAIEGKSGGFSGLPAWKFPVNQCAPFCHGTATDGDEDALLGMIYLAEALNAPDDFVDMVMRTAIAFASTDLGFPDLYRSLPDGSRMFVPKGGSDWGGLTPGSGKYGASQQPWCYNPSYFAPGHYRVFRDFVQKYWSAGFDDYLPPYLDGTPSTLKDLVASFEGAITAGYNILYHSSCPSGAVSNWVGVRSECGDGGLNCEGVPWATTPYVGRNGTCTASGTTFGSYGPDASRTPWRIAMDYILYEKEATDVQMYDRHGKPDSSLEFNAQVYLNRFANQYMRYATCDGGKAGACYMQGTVATYELASAFSMNAPGLTCKNVPNAGQDWWAGFMSYPTFTVFVAPHSNLTAKQSAQWQETLAGICDFSGKSPKGGLCSDSYFELGQELISTMVMSGHVAPLYSPGGGPPPSTASTTEFVPAPTPLPSTVAPPRAPQTTSAGPTISVSTAPATRTVPTLTPDAAPPTSRPTTTATRAPRAPAAAAGAAAEEGVCCLVGSDDGCGSCSMLAEALPSSHCSKSEAQCVGCGPRAEWCGAGGSRGSRSRGGESGSSSRPQVTSSAAPQAAAPTTTAVLQKPTTKPAEPATTAADEAATARAEAPGFCCLAGSDPLDPCGSCFGSAWSDPGGPCSNSEAACGACGPSAAWCQHGAVEPERGAGRDVFHGAVGVIRKFADADGAVPVPKRPGAGLGVALLEMAAALATVAVAVAACRGAAPRRSAPEYGCLQPRAGGEGEATA